MSKESKCWAVIAYSPYEDAILACSAQIVEYVRDHEDGDDDLSIMPDPNVPEECVPYGIYLWVGTLDQALDGDTIKLKALTMTDMQYWIAKHGAEEE